MARKKKAEIQPDDSFAHTVPPLREYLARVGAEELNFRRFMVRDFVAGNYYIERSIIRILPDGSIQCSRDEHAPTKDEAKAIQEALAGVRVPQSVLVNPRTAEEHASTLRGDPFFFHSRTEKGKIIMVRERIILDNGNKLHVPWTYWSDGRWRKMEPDGRLPMWKPPVDREIPRKMVHEGEKVARFIDDLVNNPERGDELARHPWGKELECYEHWGLIGGALAPHRADYAELKREQPVEVIYACDNDYAGQAALPEVSRHYGESIFGVYFGDQFPESWDMADKMPAALFVGKGDKRRYTGQSIKGLKFPATRATEMVDSPTGKGRRVPQLRRAFKEEWLHCVRPEVFIHRDWPHEIWTLGEFNNRIRPYSDTEDTARLIKADAAGKSAVLKYDPSTKAGVYTTGEDGRYINTHRPSTIEAEEGDTGPFEEFLGRLVPDEGDRTELARWCATLIARPDIRMNYGVLLISEMQGVGKGTLGEKILAPLVGMTNVSYPNEQEIVDSNFNYWLAHKRLAVVHEIYSGHSSRAYNRLKSIITDRYITVSKKYMANYEIENWIHMFACSNSMRAIKLTDDDRRWFMPRVTEERMPASYWIELNRWLNESGGLGIIRHWADVWLGQHEPVARGAVSPWSELKREVVEEGYSPGQAIVAKTLDRISSIITGQEDEDKDTLAKWRAESMVVNGGGVVVLDSDLVRLIRDVVYQGRQSEYLERPLTVRKLAKELGWHVGKIKVSTGMNGWGSQAHNGRIISNDPHLAGANPTDLGGVKARGDVKIKPLTLDWAREM